MNTLPVILASSFIACTSMIGCNDKARVTSRENACINNLRQIEAAKEQWSLETKTTLGQPVEISEVNSYIKGGTPSCPSQGSYTYNRVGTDATCSLIADGHALP